jgi:hypothetical protein
MKIKVVTSTDFQGYQYKIYEQVRGEWLLKKTCYTFETLQQNIGYLFLSVLFTEEGLDIHIVSTGDSFFIRSLEDLSDLIKYCKRVSSDDEQLRIELNKYFKPAKEYEEKHLAWEEEQANTMAVHG